MISYGLVEGIRFPALPQTFQFDNKLRLVLTKFQVCSESNRDIPERQDRHKPPCKAEVYNT